MRKIRLIHVSTDEVYGSIEQGDGCYTEEDKLNPTSPYAASKACGDLLVLAYYKTFGIDVCITRSSNNYGPYQFPEKVIPLFITNILQGKPLPVYGTSRNIREWLYVWDNCSAIDVVMHKGRAGEIYNIGGTYSAQNKILFPSIISGIGINFIIAMRFLSS